MQVHRNIDAALNAEKQNQTRRREAAERIGIARRKRQPTEHDESKQRDQNHAGYDAEFLAGDRENEIGMAVGKDALQRAFARSFAEPAAADETFKRGIDLKRVGHAAAGRLRI